VPLGPRLLVDAEAPPPRGLRREAEREYVRAALQRQVEAGATLVVPPYHLAGDLAEPVRQLDLRLAKIAARQFREARLGEAGRELYAALRVGFDTVRDPLARVGLVSAYAALEVEGHVVKIDGFREDVEAASELLYALQLQAGKPVVAIGAELLDDGERAAAARAEARVRRRLAQSG
jgi:hypothetical protein